jgi:parallel beta-helix repeat protein
MSISDSFIPTNAEPSRATSSASHRRTTKTKAHESTPVALQVYTSVLAFFAMLSSATVSEAVTITLSPGTNIQSAVDDNPSGTVFVLQAGVYRLQSVRPKQEDRFIGNNGADLNGSQILNTWTQTGNYWTSADAPALSTAYGPPSQYCMDPSTGCVYPQDLYLNNVPLVHKLSLPISSGQWYFDYTNDVVYLADNPVHRTVELSVAKQAFFGTNNGVTIQNLTVEKYATPIGFGAISPYGSNWTIKSNEIRLNHAAGIKAGNGQPTDNNEQILDNSVHDNGQEGIAIGGGSDSLVQYNKVFNNNYINLADGFESGGGKIAATVDARVVDNVYSNNNGNAIWGDCSASGTTISGNIITGNRLSGIRYEISHSGTISNNTLTNNAQYRGTGVCAPNGWEIVLADSDGTSVSNNTITTNCAGITLTQGSRNLEVNDQVTDNSISYARSTALRNAIGGLDPVLPYTVFDPANGNYFDYNIYHFTPSVLSLKNWVYNRSNLSWSDWKSAGEDTHGTAD